MNAVFVLSMTMLRYSVLLLLVASAAAMVPEDVNLEGPNTVVVHPIVENDASNNNNNPATTTTTKPTTTVNPKTIKTADKVADSIVAMFNTVLSSLAATTLPAFSLPLKAGSKLMLELDHCKFSQGPYLNRTSECTVDTHHKHPILSTDLAWPNPSVDCHWEFLIYDGFIKLHTNTTTFKMVAMFDGSSPVVNNTINTLQLTNFTNVDVGFDGMISLDTLLETQIVEEIDGNKKAIEDKSRALLTSGLHMVILKMINPIG